MEAHLDDIGKLLLRIVLGGCLLFHGVDKIQNLADNSLQSIHDQLEAKGLRGELKYGVLIAEVVVPVLLIIGILTRASGLVLAFNMAMAIFLVHQKSILATGAHGSWAIELPVLYLGGGLALACMGGGKLGIWRRGGVLG